MKKLFCLKDCLADTCSDPFCAPNLDCAKRTYGVWSANHKDLAPDSALIEIGDYDEEQGKVLPNDKGIIILFKAFMEESGI